MVLKFCAYCQSEISSGRSDKKFCNTHCRSAHQYKRDLKNEPFYHHVRKKLSTNRNILKTYNRSGLAKTRLMELTKLGFDPNFSTHSWQNKKGQTYKFVYEFVYEFGYLLKKENNIEKAVLVKWQDYMNITK